MSTKEKQEKKKKKKKDSYFFYDLVKVCAILPTSLFIRPKVLRINENVPKRFDGGVIVAPNHSGFSDPVVALCVFWRRRLHALATKDLFETPLKRKFFTGLHCILTDKQNFNVGSLREVCDLLKAGKAILIFPEGAVNHQYEEENVQSYKSGAILMAHLGKAPIVPVFIDKKEHWYQRQLVVIGEPIDVTTLCGRIPTVDEMEKASAYIREKELELRDHCNQYKNNKRKKKNKEK